jgi:hypothetical protein
MLDYGSDLWGMTLEEFETRVARRYFGSPHCPPGTIAPGASLDQVLSRAWGTTVDDAVDWRERLRAQLRDGSFQYIAVAQRFRPPVLRTLRYLNAAMKSARFSAVGLAEIDGLTVFWGTTGCSLRAAIPDRGPLSVGWLFPPGPPRWMGLTDLTLGWYEDASGLVITPPGRAALGQYLKRLDKLKGAARPRTSVIHGRTFSPAAAAANTATIQDAIRVLTAALLQR